MKVVITSATEKETELLRQSLNPLYFNKELPFHVDFHISGVGLLASCFSISQLVSHQKPDLIIQAGIAGTFTEKINLGTVVAVKSEYLGDTGVEENGVFKDLFDLQLASQNELPFANKSLDNIDLKKWNITALPTVTSVTINEITTRQERIAQLSQKYNPEIESMEGASLHYCCIKTGVPFIQIRAISNHVGERDKSKWAFGEAFKNLSQTVVEYIDQLNLLQETL